MSVDLRDVTGYRGEKILELCLTDYQTFSTPLFRPSFLGDKWPAIDFYVELEEVKGKRLYFLGQVKSTLSVLKPSATNLRISTKKRDVEWLLQIPGPTYIFGVHEPSKRVFVRSVHMGTPARAIKQIPVQHELTSANLKNLHDEVCDYWASANHKPTFSVFS